MNIILFDTDARNHLLPLTATRPMGELRIGISLRFGKNGSAVYVVQLLTSRKNIYRKNIRFVLRMRTLSSMVGYWRLLHFVSG
ncbi:MAG: hypothetical protein IPH31_03880 [Lewinellaceae bacterium]|nr:hypothetical protein [Lewinellaceae bacterium]